MWLLCIPHAGGTGAEFRTWGGRLGDWRAVGVTLPGRGRLMSAPLLCSMSRLADVALASVPADGRLALFGHSFGGLLALEMAARLEQLGRGPEAVVVAGTAPPGVHAERRLSALTDLDLIQALDELGGMEEEVLANRELLDLILPRLRCDLRAAEEYRWAWGRLSARLHVFQGRDDRATSPADMDGWNRVADAELQSFRGGHFFVRSSEADVLEAIHSRLAPGDGLATGVPGGAGR